MSRAPLLTCGTNYAVSGHGNSLYEVAPDMCLEPVAVRVWGIGQKKVQEKESQRRVDDWESTQRHCLAKGASDHYLLEYMLFFPVRAVNITVALTRPGRFVDSASPFVRNVPACSVLWLWLWLWL